MLLLFMLSPQATAQNNAPAKLVKTGSNPTVFYVNSNGNKIPLASSKIFLSYKFKWKDVRTISEQELGAYPDALYIKLSNSKKIYKIENGIKRLVTQEAVALLNLSDKEIFSVNKTHFDSFKTGNDLLAGEVNTISAKADTESPSFQLDNSSGGCTEDASVGGRDGCVMYQAITEGKVSLCDSVQDEKWKSACFGSFEGDANDPFSNCRKLDNTQYRNDCFMRIAVKKKDLQLCQNVFSGSADASKKIECQANIGVVANRPDLCEKLPDFAGDEAKATKDSCYYSFALINNNGSVCDKIKDGSPFKAACKKFILQTNQVQAASQ